MLQESAAMEGGSVFLPGTGRWQCAALTEGTAGLALLCHVAPRRESPPPPAAVPLPVPGRNWE